MRFRSKPIDGVYKRVDSLGDRTMNWVKIDCHLINLENVEGISLSKSGQLMVSCVGGHSYCLFPDRPDDAMKEFARLEYLVNITVT